jgi:hypothetical protein
MSSRSNRIRRCADRVTRINGLGLIGKGEETRLKRGADQYGPRQTRIIVTHASRAGLSFAATIRVLEVDVADDPKRTVDEVASDLDDLTTRVEELEVDPAADEHAKELGRLRLALEDAGDAADAVEETMDGEKDERSRNH